MAVGNGKMTPGRALRGLLVAALTLASTVPAVAATAAAPAKIGPHWRRAGEAVGGFGARGVAVLAPPGGTQGAG
jgi:hypothetical protein